MKGSDKRIAGERDYNNYSFSLKQYLGYGSMGVMLILIFSYIFYESMIIAVVFLPVLIPYFKAVKKIQCTRQQQKLKEEFKELCMSMAAQMSAGYSVENSIKEALKEMQELYGENSFICQELKIIIGKIRNNISVEEAMLQLAVRSGNSDILLFSEVLSIGKRSGGDLIGIVRSAAVNISEKTEVEREIRAVISEKQYEQTIMNIIPLAMIMYVNVSSPDMMDVMYHTVGGRIVMSICLAFYVLAFWLGRKIIEIEW